MAKRYLKSLSFKVSASPTKTSNASKIHGQSSLPARFNPHISSLDDQIHSLKSSLHPQKRQSPADLLSKLQDVHDCLEVLLRRLRSQSQIRSRSPFTHYLLDDFLILTDAFATLVHSTVLLKDAYSATRSAVRRGVESEVRSCVRDQRRVEKEIRRISGGLRGAGRWSLVGVKEDEVAAAAREAVEVTTVMMGKVVGEVAGMSTEVGVGVKERSCLMGCVTGTMVVEEEMRQEVMGKLERMEEVAKEVGRRSESLYRSLVNARVFLLNASAPL